MRSHLARLASWATRGGCVSARRLAGDFPIHAGVQASGRHPPTVAGGILPRGLALPRVGIREMSAAPGGSSPPAPSNPEHEFDPDLLRALEIDHIPPARIAEALKSENITIAELKMLVDDGFHQNPGGAPVYKSLEEQAALSRNASEWSADLVHQLNPRRRFFPGQTYLPEELSPNFQVDYVALREQQRRLGCPLGGKKGPAIDYTNVFLLSRFVTEGGQIIPRRKTNVCAKKQRELKTALKRARTMNLIPYKSKLPQFQRGENPLVDS